MSGDITEAENYYSKDFEWEQLRLEVETDPTFLYHLLPFNSDGVSNSTTDSSNSSPLEDSDAWNKFHSRHSTGKFFKERRYLLKEFPELACRGHSKVLEVGCGNGSTALPILRATENSVIYACDCSNEALDRAKENISAANLTTAQDRFHPFLCDVSTFEFPKWLACISCQERFMTAGETQYSLCSEERTCCIGGVDLVTLIFTLSALPLHRMTMAIKQCFSVLKPGGILLFRDYGLYDMTMLRFYPEQRVGYREYMRSDGTRSYFFSLEFTRDLFSSAGFTELELEYCCVRSTNRRNGKIMRRVWVHGKFQKGK
ncbi:OLC1v1026492C3 [Oldenlandia corymbosa var. corymbosa]|uniref:tRNA N(3)-methylcytidine methyltransferase n=1 Tax=Oldenlandia corymbosa var. corymbosa TaxID=529605 RepID=A0AAV1C772_OLDCO|nr:OLC1v1026492C3 [Oldenlandia corymbosa var. corymbosa]